MIRVVYPGENPPERVTVGHETIEVSGGGFEVADHEMVRTLARRWGVHPATIRDDQCGEIIGSGPREGVPCDNTVPCSHHNDDDGGGE